MKIEGSYRALKGAQKTIYDLMMDPEILAKSIPGCKELREIEPDKYWCDLAWGYSGVVQVERISPPSQVKIVVEGKGPAGSVKATGVVEFQSQGEERTLIKYKGEFYLGGPAALLQMGSSMFGGLPYKKLLDSFFSNFETQLVTDKD